jgi:glycosyltransferase involved in cell wall biosynthesis
MTTLTPLLTIVVPCYNEEAVLPETTRRLMALLDSLVASGAVRDDSHVCFVDDGSADATWRMIETLSAQSPRIRGMKLSRNRGHQNALLAGLLSATGDVVVSMDADLQDDVTAVNAMLSEYRRGSQLVYGVRKRRDVDSAFKRWTALSFYRLMRRMGAEIIYNHADYRLMSRVAVEALREYGEVNLFLRGIVPQLGFRWSTVEYDRGERFAGESKYPLPVMLSLAVQGLTSFSTVPLRIITVLGLTVSLLSSAVTVWALIARFVSPDVVPGWASTVVPIYFLGGVQLLSMGILGEYLAKTYLETKRRPRYIVETTVGGPHEGETSGSGGRPPAP